MVIESFCANEIVSFSDVFLQCSAAFPLAAENVYYHTDSRASSIIKKFCKEQS